MSTPVRYCALVEAVDKPEAFDKLYPTMHRNILGGHFSIWPCTHDPPCRGLTEAEQIDLMRRFKKPLAALEE